MQESLDLKPSRARVRYSPHHRRRPAGPVCYDFVKFGTLDVDLSTIQSTDTMQTIAPARHDVSLLTDQDLDLFNEGSHYRLYENLDAHLVNVNGEHGTYFAVC